jgi:poly-gamma-glutamate synthesis protein (capsule biosynthesis protein)
VKIFLTGDVMTGRGVDQVIPYPCAPRIDERGASSATEYVQLADRANGRILRPVSFEYPWGAALDELRSSVPAIYVANLETAITRSEDFLPKGVNYRMSLDNVQCLASAGINCCVFANNHVLDWGEAGLIYTLDNLRELGIQAVGAGRNAVEAQSPVILSADQNRRVIVCTVASATSGTPGNWAAGENSPGPERPPRTL